MDPLNDPSVRGEINEVQTNSQEPTLNSDRKINRQKSLSNTSRSFRLDHTFKQIATRIQVANKLSMAKRIEDRTSIHGSILLEEPNSSSGSKLVQTIVPSISRSRNRSINRNRNEQMAGVISRGNLIFDVDYTLATNIKKTVSRPYVYVTPDVELKNITDIMFSEWNLSVPRIALFLLTDPDHLRTWNNARQITLFKTGIMKAAEATSMWLLTNGLDVGVGKLISDALIESQSEMQHCRSLFEKNHKHFPVMGITNDLNLTYTQELNGSTVHLNQTNPIPSQRRYELNCMHTNFLILRSVNSSEDSYHNLMINLIDHLTKRASLSPEQEVHNAPVFSNVFMQSGDLKSKSSLRRRHSGNRNSEKPQQNLDIILRPSYGQKTHCFTSDHQEDMLDTFQDEEVCEDDVSFVSPEGTVVEDNHENSPRSISPTIETDTANRIKNATQKMIPIVCLVIQGDYNCAKLVLANIRRRNPVIVLRGSGGFADILSFAFIEMQHRCRDLYQAWDAEFVEQTLKPLLVQKIVKHFPELRNNLLVIRTFRDRIIECIRESGSDCGRVYLSILNMHNSSCDLSNLPEFILLSLFKSQNRRDKIDSFLIRKDLYLTMDWNCPEVALREVLSRNPSFNIQLEKSFFEVAILKSNREEFVDLFLSHGFRIHKYLTPFRLIRLIRYSLLQSDFFRTVCMEAILGVAVWSMSFEELLERLTVSHSPETENFISNELNELIFTTTALNDFVKIDDLYLNIMGMYPVDAGSAERIALATLAMWAVFNRRFRLAEILWKHSDQPIHLGLILSMMLDRIAWFVSEQNLKDDLQSKSKVFARYSIEVLDSCYRNDEQRSFELLGQKNSDWGQQTAVDIAANGSHRAFIAHPCCQKWLTNRFNGRIRVRELSWGILTIPPVVKIILSAFLILPMYIWIRFLDSDHQWAMNKAKLFEELNNDDYSDSDDEELTNLAKAADEIKLIPLNNQFKNKNHRKKSTVLEMLVDNQMTITSIDDSEVREALARFKNKIKKREAAKSSYDRQRNNLFIDKQPPLWKMINLMWNSPITKFWTYQVFYIIYLVIWPGCGNWNLDVAVCLWTFLNLIEHMQRVFVLYKRYTSLPMFFLIIETILLIVFLTTYTWGRIVIVFSYHVNVNGHWLTGYNIDPYTMKVILCAGLLYFYYRLFYIHLPISPTLGPLLYRFKLMVSVDFIHFMRMALILLISSGIIVQTLMYPNTEMSSEMFHKAFHRSIVSLFTTPVDELTKNCTSFKPKPPSNHSIVNVTYFFDNLVFDPTSSKSMAISANELCPVEPIPMSRSCPVSGFWSYAFTFQYLICLKLILMTLLYALFASTATKLQTETDHIWKFQRYTLVVDFANRPAIHAPLSIFKYCYLTIKYLVGIFICECCCNPKRKTKVADQPDSKEGVFLSQEDDQDTKQRLSKEDYNYWRNLAKTIYDEEKRKEEEKEIISKQNETIQLICEELEREKNILGTIKTKMNEFERIMYQIQISLESIKHVNGGDASSGLDSFHKNRVIRSTPTISTRIIHQLSRLSPYPGTRIQRFPVADKFVSWDVIWINYDPIIYSRKQDNFPTLLKNWVDEDILAIKERTKALIKRNSDPSAPGVHLPVFNWNALSVNPAGLTIDRRSWINENIACDTLDCNLSPVVATPSKAEDNHLIYKLDEDEIPRNILGRTGLKGKGNLPRWGPNHYVMLIISRSRLVNSVDGTLFHEFLMEPKYSSLFVPMRFIGDDQLFSGLRSMFRSSSVISTSDNWNTDQDLVKFFQSADPGVHLFPIFVSYMDSPDNTDNAWKEVKVYHFHFGPKIDIHSTDEIIRLNNRNQDDIENLITPTSRNTIIDDNLSWVMYHEDMLVKLPMEQVQFINDAMRRISNLSNV